MADAHATSKSHSGHSKSSMKIIKKRVNFTTMPLVIGAFFGYLFHRSEFLEPGDFRRGLVGKDMNMELIKTYLLSIASTYLFFFVLYFTMPKKFRAIQLVRSKAGGTVLSALVGGCLLAWGMGIVGSDPLGVVLQAGSLHPSAFWVMAGGVIGALLQGLTEPFVKQVLRKGPVVRGALNEFLHLPYPAWAVLMISCCIGGAYQLDNTVLKNALPTDFFHHVWPYQTIALGIGLTQAMLVYFLSTSLSSSSAYATLAGQWLALLPADSPVRKTFRHLDAKSSGLDNWWMVFFMTSIGLSTFFTAQITQRLMSGGWLSSFAAPDPSIPDALVGGAMMVFGGRTAGGCFFGHGVSGVSFGSSFSLMVVLVAIATFHLTAQHGLLQPYESCLKHLGF